MEGGGPMMFTKEDILNELVASDGRMLNSQLVLRFARYLKNPATKEEAKAKFKDYVNKLATLVTDPQSGDKFVVLRPEVRGQGRRQPMPSMPPGAGPSLQLAPSHFAPLAPQSSTGHPMRAAYPGVAVSLAAQSAAPQQPLRAPSQVQTQSLQQQQLPPVPPPHSKGGGHQIPPGPPPGRPARAPPAYQQAVSSSKLSRAPVPAVAGPPLPTQPHPNNQNVPSSSGVPLGMFSGPTPSHHPLRGRPSSLKLVHSGHGSHTHIDSSGSGSVVDVPVTPGPALTPPASSHGLPPGYMGHHQRRSSAGMINTQLLQQSGMVIPKASTISGPPPPPPLRNLSKSVPSLLADGSMGDIDSDCPPAVPSRSRRHSAKGTAVEEKVKQFAEKEFIKDEIRSALADKTSVAVSPGTVKEKVQMLKMTSEGNLTAPAPQSHQLSLRPPSAQRDGGTSAAGGPRRALSSRNSNHDADDKCSVSTLDPLRREFCRKSMTCDYQSMQKMLQEDSSLARAVDYVLGYNALHWAAKYGNCDVVKLIAGTYNVDPNIRTRGAGQTPLHIAYMFNQKAIIDLLIMTYGAQKDIRDFSGRRPDFYGNQKNVETLRSRIYQTEKDKGKEDRTKEISSKRHHKWQMWSNKDDNEVSEDREQMRKDRSLPRHLSAAGASAGKVKSSRNLFGRFWGSRDDISLGDKWGSLSSSWRKYGTLRSSSSLIDDAKPDQCNSKQRKEQQRGQQQQQQLEPEQHQPTEPNDSPRTDQCSLSSFAETSSIEQHDDAEVRSCSSDIGGRPASRSRDFLTSRSNISI